MAQARNGDTVKVHYTGKFEDGAVFDSSSNRDPMQFVIGEGRLIPGFEKAIVGMSPGESKSVTLLPEEAYGPHHEQMVQVIDRKQVPSNLKLEVGQQLEVRRPDGQITLLMVTDVSDSSVTLDANHPLAGKNLIFDIELVEIV
ncbi:MAG: peptidylprolyl isomerase [Deltaproteobacteria bacterium]|nr:peptidylprolyl isomerase [Deltaproteobacteria bacterium]MBW2019598.1 peptidylprolyl isomerase [Deltaproteobacteria bacterium]MBW2074413.1 peptidylprolyl isomerase [Deltaproteobacteria bacterium]RLB82355.1 MAG: peptidylprolyl isomerase [Deltaproteobacteria bacterium]